MKPFVFAEGPVESLGCVYVNDEHACDHPGVQRADGECPKKRPLCSLAMIALVRDEAELEAIKRALASVASIVDQVVVVLDDRSLDSDALNLVGALVIRRKFESFSDQRNFAASLCSGEWVLVLDADDHFIDVGDLRVAMQVAPRDVARIQCTETVVDEVGHEIERGTTVVAYRRAACSWKYRAHNLLVGADGPRMQSTAVMLYAHPRDATGEAHWRRTIPLLLRDVEENPGDARPPYLLARTHWVLKDVAETKRWAALAVDLDPTSLEHAPAWWLLAISTFDEDGPDACEAVAERGLRVHPQHIDLLDIRAMVFAVRKMLACSDPANPFLRNTMGTIRYAKRLEEVALSLGWPISAKAAS
jgi:hypothetical protein